VPAAGVVLIGGFSPLFPAAGNKFLGFLGFVAVLSAAGHLFAATAPPTEPGTLPWPLRRHRPLDSCREHHLAQRPGDTCPYAASDRHSAALSR
jgi:hypothetical protein